MSIAGICRLVVVACSLVPITSEVSAHDFAVGQVWSYQTRPGEEKSTVLIDKIETDAKLGSIFHISISSVHVRSKLAASGIATILPHCPVSKQSLEMSVTRLVGQAPPNPEFEAGYAEWRQAFDRGRAGIFTISIAEIVDTFERLLEKASQRHDTNYQKEAGTD
jgi:hypothetical protein